jgi:hypothetical protein
MSEIKVNKLTPRTNCGTVTLGDSGDTFTIPSGATISNLGTATGFGGTGVVSWDTASIKTTGFTAVTGTGYFCNTTGGGFTVTLPASPSAGDVVGVADYAKTFDTDNLTLGRNSEKIGGDADDALITTEGLAVTLVYVDSTKGWLVTDSGLQSDAPGPTFVTATGGCITTCGNCKIHTFFSPATFCVSEVATCAANNVVSYMVVAGGGGTGANAPGGGGAGGFREYKSPVTPYTASPLDGNPGGTAITVSASPYPITVGAAGAGTGPGPVGGSGGVSTFSTICSAGGGGGGGWPSKCGAAGGSGGGGRANQGGLGGAGNTPSTTPAQGFAGGNAAPSPTPSPYLGGGGGGATTVGATGNPGDGGGGTGAGTEINTSTMPAPSPVGAAQIGTPGPSAPLRYFAGGGGGASNDSPPVAGGPGGTGGGGAAGNGTSVGNAGTINTGGGGGGPGAGYSPNSGIGGGSGIVVIRYKYQ